MQISVDHGSPGSMNIIYIIAHVSIAQKKNEEWKKVVRARIPGGCCETLSPRNGYINKTGTIAMENNTIQTKTDLVQFSDICILEQQLLLIIL